MSCSRRRFLLLSLMKPLGASIMETPLRAGAFSLSRTRKHAGALGAEKECGGEGGESYVRGGAPGGVHFFSRPLGGEGFPRLRGDLQQQRAGAAGGIIGGGGSHGVLRGDTDDLGDDPADLRRGVELPLALAAL